LERNKDVGICRDEKRERCGFDNNTHPEGEKSPTKKTHTVEGKTAKKLWKYRNSPNKQELLLRMG
jgi:hypothetical protein